MILNNSLYRTGSLQITDARQTLATIALIRENEIFKAHFPGLPVLPGACLVQISKEFVENLLNRKIQITTFKNLKFLKTINPDEFPEINISFSLIKHDTHYAAAVTYTKDEHLFCKLDYYFITQ